MEDAWAMRFWMSRSFFERVVDVGAEVLELLDEVYVGPVVEDDRRGITVGVGALRARTEEGDRLRRLLSRADVLLESPAGEVDPDDPGARLDVRA